MSSEGYASGGGTYDGSGGASGGGTFSGSVEAAGGTAKSSPGVDGRSSRYSHLRRTRPRRGGHPGPGPAKDRSGEHALDVALDRVSRGRDPRTGER